MIPVGRRRLAIDKMPDRASSGGFIYVIGFANNTVKVGSTITPAARLRKHESDAKAFDIEFDDWWLSDEHATYLESERQLIDVVSLMGGRRARREYFHDLYFVNVLVAARKIARGDSYYPGPPFTRREGDAPVDGDLIQRPPLRISRSVRRRYARSAA